MIPAACPPATVWQDYVDAPAGATASAELERHLLDCGVCRDRVRAVRRVAQFAAAYVESAPAAAEDVARLVDAARAAAAAAETAGARVAPFAASRWWRPACGAALFAVACASAYWAATRGAESDATSSFATPSNPAPRREEPVVRSDGASAAPPGVAPAAFPSASRPAPWTSSAPPPTFAEALAEALERPGRSDEIVRRVDRLLRAPARTPEEIVEGGRALLARVGAAAEPSLHRTLRLRDVPAEAALPLWTEMRGAEATSALAAAAVATAAPAFETALRARPGALEAARAYRAPQGDRDARFKAAALVARLGGNEVADELSADLYDPARRVVAATALATLATTDALVALARVLPGAEDFDADRLDPEASAVLTAVRRTPDVGGKAVAASRSVTRVSDRRRLLLLAGLSGDAAVRPALEAALARAEDRGVALAALGILGAPEAAPAIAAAGAAADRGERRRAVDALSRLSGTAAVDGLSALLAHADSREAAVRALADRPDSLPGLLRALAYSDVRPLAAAELRVRAGDAAPRDDDPAAWAKWARAKAKDE